jgi:hypothetical protein
MKWTISVRGASLITAILFSACGTSDQAVRMLSGTPPHMSQSLDSGWVCKSAREVTVTGEALSISSFPLSGWIPATVPGTVLATLVNNGLAPDPFYGMNNEKIPDIFHAGPELYTYWFVKDLRMAVTGTGKQAWLRFRGVNYSCDIFLNGRRVNTRTHTGMFLRQSYNVTSLLSPDGINRLAVIVRPAGTPGDPNGGQGGDGTIGRNVASQYTAGWDWIQPVRDRNTGIWDIVTLEETGAIRLNDPHIVSSVPGVRFPDAPQAPATLRITVDVENPTHQRISGTLQCTVAGMAVRTDIAVPANTTILARVHDITVQDPKLWWPNGYGQPARTTVELAFVQTGGEVLDTMTVTTGIRDISTVWNAETRSREVRVNGQRIFVRGGNWIVSDAMLRLSTSRYDADIRFHRDMNLNLIRVWGGGLTERPEFYDACDRYGILVMQDLWISGDCNGKWLDPMKKEDQWTRRGYPDDHGLFIRSFADQVRMLRNHPSLAFYCGGNEIPPPQDILAAVQDSVLPVLDGTRYFFTYSNADSMSFNSLGGNGDGAYHIQPTRHFWEFRAFPFNSETGSVGLNDMASLERFIPRSNMVMPDAAGRRVDSVWRYHKFQGYGKTIEAYGRPDDLKGYLDRAQLVNYDQYRALMEGHLAHMWEWYTGVIIWKTQNPWSAMRGQMYDPWLDPNAALYGLHHANRPVHIMCNPADGMLMVVNSTFRPLHDLMVQAWTIDVAGKRDLAFQWFVEVGPSTAQKIDSVRRVFMQNFGAEGGFLELLLLDLQKRQVDRNLCWFPDSNGAYTGLQRMPAAPANISARRNGDGRVDVSVENPPGGPLAFFLRVSLIDGMTGKRILPVFYSDNYVSVVSGTTETVTLECGHGSIPGNARVTVSGWNFPEHIVPIQ